MEKSTAATHVNHSVSVQAERRCALVVTEVRDANGELLRTQGSRLPIISLLELADLEDTTLAE